jgi:hypothetical protein
VWHFVSYPVTRRLPKSTYMCTRTQYACTHHNTCITRTLTQRTNTTLSLSRSLSVSLTHWRACTDTHMHLPHTCITLTTYMHHTHTDITNKHSSLSFSLSLSHRRFCGQMLWYKPESGSEFYKHHNQSRHRRRCGRETQSSIVSTGDLVPPWRRGSLIVQRGRGSSWPWPSLEIRA